MDFELQNGILVPVPEPPPRPKEPETNLCILCRRPVTEPEYFNQNWPWPTCGHGRFPRHWDCMRALDNAFPLTDPFTLSKWRSAAYAQASCPTCGCNCEYT